MILVVSTKMTLNSEELKMTLEIFNCTLAYANNIKDENEIVLSPKMVQMAFKSMNLFIESPPALDLAGFQKYYESLVYMNYRYLYIILLTCR